MNFKIIENIRELNDFMELCKHSKSPYIVLDTETDNKIEKKARLYGIGIALEADESFYIPIRYKGQGDEPGKKWWDEAIEQEFATWLFNYTSNKKLIGHNIIYDVLVLLENWKLDFTPFIYSDTILQKHLIDSDRPHGLKETSVKYLGSWADKAQTRLYENIETNGGKALKSNMEMFKANTEVLGEYCCWDTMLTRKLFDLFEPQVKKDFNDLFYVDEIMPLYKLVTIPMKIKGFPISVVHFQDLNERITIDIEMLEKELQQSLKPHIADYEKELLEDMYPEKRGGLFPKFYAKMVNFSLPEKDGKITLAKKELDKIVGVSKPEHLVYLEWLKGTGTLNAEVKHKVQRLWWNYDNGGYVFNLKSNADLIHLFFTRLGYEPLSLTDGGAPQCNDDFLESVKTEYVWISKLVEYKKLQKLKTTYIDGILEQQVNGVLYTSMLQFGTTSGRYSSRSPNLQNIPRVKEDDSGLSELVLTYVNDIKRGFIAPEGYKIVNADYSQLEPRSFAEASGDALLQQSFINGEDLYGAIAKSVWQLSCAPNEVKKKHPEYRQKAKVIALAVVYGAGASRIADLMKISFEEAQVIIDNYMAAYPQLKDYMNGCDDLACSQGIAKTKFGRIVHLKNAKRLFDQYGFRLLNYKYAKENGIEDIRWKMKNDLNLAKNHPIQGVAAHVVNRAAIAISREFKKHNIQGGIVIQVHDELTSIVADKDTEIACKIVKNCMENTVKLSVPLVAEPQVASNWADSK